MRKVQSQAQEMYGRTWTFQPYFNLLGILVFTSILAMILAQAQSQRLESLLYLGRWIPLGLLLVYAMGRWASEPRWSGPSIRWGRSFDLWILGWIGLAYVSTTYSIAPQATVRLATTFVLGYGAVFWGVWLYADRYGEQPVITLLVAGAALVMLASLGGLLGGIESTLGVSISDQSGGVGRSIRFRGILENPNSLGMMCAFTLPLFLDQLIRKRDIYTSVLFGGMVVTLFLTGSRGSLGASVIGCGYVLWKAKGIDKNTILIALVGAVALGVYSLQGTIISVILRPEQLETASGRFLIWELFWDYIRNRPFLGHGWGTEDLLHRHYGTNLQRLGVRGVYAGSSYIGFSAQVGLIGAGLFFAPLLWLSGRTAMIPRGQSVRIHALNAVLIVGLTTATVESWMSSLGNAQALLFWIPVMLLVRRHVLAHRASAEARRTQAASVHGT